MTDPNALLTGTEAELQFLSAVAAQLAKLFGVRCDVASGG